MHFPVDYFEITCKFEITRKSMKSPTNFKTITRFFDPKNITSANILVDNGDMSKETCHNII